MLDVLSDLFFLIRIMAGGVHIGSTRDLSIAPAPGDREDGEFGGMKIGRGNRSTRRKPTPAPLCPPQIPLDQTWGLEPEPPRWEASD
jgi:hypothetical protein